jgi:hypothetical protein
VMSLLTWNAVSRPFGEPANAIGGRDWTGCWPMGVKAGRDDWSQGLRTSQVIWVIWGKQE